MGCDVSFCTSTTLWAKACLQKFTSHLSHGGVTYGFGIVASAYGHDVVAVREPPALAAMRIIAGCALIRIAANDPHGGGSRTAASHGAPWPETIRHTFLTGAS
jgi:hypothetical protein